MAPWARASFPKTKFFINLYLFVEAINLCKSKRLFYDIHHSRTKRINQTELLIFNITIPCFDLKEEKVFYLLSELV
jgi:hypothetical protein